jgi:universal stress protein E
MYRIRRILVAVKDPAARLHPGLAKATQLARATGAELVLFQAIPAPGYLSGDIALLNEGLADAERSARSDSLARLEALGRPLRRRGVKVTLSARWDSPVYEAIIREATRLRADLIVAERHAGRHVAPGLMHFTDWELLRLSPVPVLLIKRTDAYRKPVVLAALDPDHAYDKPARLDREILRAASTLAEALHGALHAVHAYVPLPLTAFSYGAPSQEALVRLARESAKRSARKLDRTVRAVGIPRSRRHLIGRHATDAIEQAAAETHSAIVAMGAISRSGLKRLLIGNTAEKVMDRLACDLLVVKPPALQRLAPPRHRAALRRQAPADMRSVDPRD